ncbi:TPA: PTS transporter subunit EIIC [Klebsiella pneumoniae]|nr:PTS transporter subunit EIIC [Klebsiella pneumoniae]
MKTLLIIDAGLGQARAYMAKTLLGAAAPKAHLELIDNPNDAELAIVLGTALPADSALNGKNVYLGDINRAVAHPELFLGEAKDHAKPYVAPAAVAVPAAAQGQKRIVAVTACPTGVSYMLPMVVAGGLCIALSFAFGIKAFEVKDTLAAALMQIGGGSAFALMVPVLAGFIAFSIADRPGLTPGLIGGMLAVSGGSGFIGGIIAGFLAGYVAKAISTKLKLPQSMEALKPILIIPLVSSLIVGLAMIYLIGKPVAGILAWLTHWLQTMGTANAVLLGAILGAMMCTDMGGPVNKAAYAFGVGLLSTQTYAPMAAIMAAGMVPPLAMGIATLVARNKFDKGQREGGKAALVLGLCFISEGAIPFAARDPMRVLPCCIVGGAVTGAISMAVGAKLMAPHGGLFVLLIPGAITPVLGYLLAIVAGTLVAGLAYAVLKRPEAQTAEVEKAA